MSNNYPIKMKKTFLILLFMGLANLLLSCIPCGNDGPSHFRINEIEAEFGTFNSKTGSYRFEKTEGDTLDFLNAFIQITPVDFEYVLKEVRNYSFGSAVFACSPSDPSHAQKIVRISITSPETLYLKERIVPANELLSKYFRINRTYSINNFIANRPYFTSPGERLDFKLNTPPARMINQPFRFVIEMDDGKVFDLTTDNIKIAAD